MADKLRIAIVDNSPILLEKEYGKEILKIEKKYLPKDNENESNREKLIVSVTSWKKRVGNLPTVLDTIFNQTKLPDKIVINLSSEEFPEKEKELPAELLNYLKSHNLAEINWVDGPNRRQWKKFIPTLQKYPNDTIICIDDDFKYPEDMVETFWNAHLKNPNNPISGNSFRFGGVQCHCGCASLVRLEYLKGLFEMATEETMKHQSSDLFYTYIAAKAGTPYIYCGKSYSTNMVKYNEVSPLRTVVKENNPLYGMWHYLEDTFGKLNDNKKSVAKKPVVETPKAEPVKKVEEPKKVETKKTETTPKQTVETKKIEPIVKATPKKVGRPKKKEEPIRQRLSLMERLQLKLGNIE